MFCIVHNYCPKAADNGHCSVYYPEGVALRNSRGGACVWAVLPEAKFVVKAAVKAKNALKASKAAAANKG